MIKKNRIKHRKKARELRSQMRKIDQMIRGSINFRQITCGKPNCKCARGQLHQCVSITYKDRGKTKTVYIDKSRQAEALMMCANYKKMKALIKELTLVNLQLVQSERRSKNGKKE